MVTFITKFHGPTNYNGARISVQDSSKRWPKKFYSYEYTGAPHEKAFIQYLEFIGSQGARFSEDEFIIGDTDCGIVAVLSYDRKIKNGVITRG